VIAAITEIVLSESSFVVFDSNCGGMMR
jgi:hypothetical protein